MTSPHLHLDTREPDLQHLLRHLGPTVSPLHIGDAQITLTHEGEPVIHLVIERKTTNDLAASIRDGRYHEQKARILSTVPARHCAYIIESADGLSAPPGGMSESVFHGALMSTMFRDGIHVILTRDVTETAAWIAAIFDRCTATPAKFAQDAGGTAPSEYTACARIKSRKIDNIDPPTCFLLQLGQIPGVSHALAKSIADRFPNWRALLAALDACGDETEQVAMLSKLPLVGQKKARTILDFTKGCV